MPPLYKSEAIMLIQEEKITNPFLSGLAISTTVRDRINTLVKIILSTPVLEEVIKDAGLEVKGENKEELIEELRHNIQVSLIGGSLLKVECINKDPVVAQRVAGSISAIFVQKNLELQMKETDTGIEFLEKQKQLYAQKLADAERALRDFKIKYQEMLSKSASEEVSKILGTPMVMNTELLRYTKYKQNLIDLNLRLKELMARKRKIKEQLDKEPLYIVSEKTSDPILKQLESNLAQKQVELAKLEIDAKPSHPLVIRLKEEIKELKKKIDERRRLSPTGETKEVINPIYQELKTALRELDSDIESLKTKIELTQVYLEDYAKKIKMIPLWEEQLAVLERDYKINSDMYAQITKKLETAYLTRRLEIEEKGTRFRVVEPPKVPSKPFRPNRKLMAMGGGLVGLVLGMGLVFLTEMTDHSFTDVNQLRNFLDIPVVGYISQILTVQEAKELKAKRTFYLLLFFIFIFFVIVGAVIRYISVIR